MTVLVLANHLGAVGMQPAVTALQNGDSLLDALEAGITPVEADISVESVGLGGAPNLLGELETDAAIMDGSSLNIGTIGALKGYSNTLWLARKVMEELPHTMIVGEGAARFAAEQGAEPIKQLPEKVLTDYQDWVSTNVSQSDREKWPDVPLAKYAGLDSKVEKDTVIFLVRNMQGQIAGATSTSGWNYKYPGRLGDSPIIGAGLYVDNAYGACACTHTGEMTMRAGTARSVVAYMKAGASVKEACLEAVDDLRRLKDGYIGPVVIHAIDAAGEPFVATTTNTDISYCLWTSESNQITECKATVAPPRTQ